MPYVFVEKRFQEVLKQNNIFLTQTNFVLPIQFSFQLCSGPASSVYTLLWKRSAQERFPVQREDCPFLCAVLYSGGQELSDYDQFGSPFTISYLVRSRSLHTQLCWKLDVLYLKNTSRRSCCKGLWPVASDPRVKPNLFVRPLQGLIVQTFVLLQRISPRSIL